MPMREIGMAMLEIRKRAEEWQVDMDRVAVCGFSAGAHNSAMFSTRWNEPVVYEYLNCKPEDIKPAACILGYTLSDYNVMKETSEGNQFLNMFFGVSNTAFLGTATPDQQLLDDVSPALHVNENTPPMFLWATAGDHLVPVQNTIVMSHALANAGIPFEVHIFEEGEHGLATADQASASNKAQVDVNAAKWVGLCEQWLLKRFALNLPDAPVYDAGSMGM